MKKAKKSEMTIDDLAIMVSRGFENTATKQDIHEIKEEMNERFDNVNIRLDHIEHHLIFGHTNRLESLEDSVRLLKTKAGVH